MNFYESIDLMVEIYITINSSVITQLINHLKLILRYMSIERHVENIMEINESI